LQPESLGLGVCLVERRVGEHGGGKQREKNVTNKLKLGDRLGGGWSRLGPPTDWYVDEALRKGPSGLGKAAGLWGAKNDHGSS